MKRFPISLMTIVSLAIFTMSASADVKIRQKISTGGQSFETTRSIKGKRERTEQKMEIADPSMADYMPQIATVTQCDLRRTVRLNDRRQLYMVEPFQTADATEVTRTTPEPARTVTTRKGGTITMSYNVKDTGERKMMFGMQARHLIITQEMESSPDSCNGPSKMKMEYDGWYVDFSADFSCPNAQPAAPVQRPTQKPDCVDRTVFKGSGTAQLGFLLEGTMKMFGADGTVQMTQTTETLELSRAPIDAALFDVPAAYKQVSSSQDLYAISMPGAPPGMPDPGERQPRSASTSRPSTSAPLAKSVAVNISVPPGSAASQAEIDQYVRSQIVSRGLRAVSGTGDYTLTIQFKQIKESTAGKIGGMFGKVTGVPSGGIGKVDIDMTANLSGVSSGDAKVKNKFDGPPARAVHAALDQALGQLLSGIGN